MAESPTTWHVMNDLEEAFNQIGTFDFLLDQLGRHIDEQNQQGIVDTFHALIAFLPPYTQNFDDKFKVAWKQTVKPQIVDTESWEHSTYDEFIDELLSND